MGKTFNIFFLIIVVFSAYFYRDKLENVIAQSVTYYFPCKIPISYSIGTFDERFGISKADFLKSISSAETMWESSIKKDLFKYSEDGRLKINLIYDQRQDTTLQLKNMGIVVENDRASYDSMKAKYDSLNSEYKKQKVAFDGRVSTFESRRKVYEAEVAAANKKGGANKETYNKLNAERDYLNKEAASINLEQASLNKRINDLNALTSTLNQLAQKLNINVDKFNTIGGQFGGEFDEGVYKSGPDGEEIDIYQFDNKTKLVRVLAHELGHALGLDHIEDPKAIMYRLNNGVNEKLTSSDLVILKDLCGIK